jgi:hypothetical protein
MNWIKRYSVNLFILILSFGISLLIAESLAGLWVTNEKTHFAENEQTQAAERALKRFNMPDVVQFEELYAPRLHHLRSYDAFPTSFDYTKSAFPATTLLFTTIRPFEPDRHANILIQGDSWAGSARFADQFLQEFSKRKNVGLIAAGVSSYSPSPMTIQLDILRTDFNIHPSVVIAIIDQTDIGDELFRYKNRRFNQQGRLVALGKSEWADKRYLFWRQYRENLRSNSYALVKLIRHVIIKFNESRTNENLYSEPRGKDILSPLIKGVNNETKDLFIKRVINYINVVFDDPITSLLVFVTHPHRNHLLPKSNVKKYKGEVGELIQLAIEQSNKKSQIIHIDFLKTDRPALDSQNKSSLFKEGDRFSHLTSEMYKSYYYPHIMSYFDE